jgi:hypothetical protein
MSENESLAGANILLFKTLCPLWRKKSIVESPCKNTMKFLEVLFVEAALPSLICQPH